jgi:hypothetical protein
MINRHAAVTGRIYRLRGNRWVFDAETVCGLEQEEGAPFWYSYCYDRRNISTFERCAALLWVKVAPVSAEEQKAE